MIFPCTTNGKWRSQSQLNIYNSDFHVKKNKLIVCTMCASIKDKEKNTAHPKNLFLQFLSPMIHLCTQAMQSGGTARSVQRDLIIALVNWPSCWRSPIFSHWSDRGMSEFCYSVVWRAVQTPSLPTSMLIPTIGQGVVCLLFSTHIIINNHDEQNWLKIETNFIICKQYIFFFT